MSAADRIEVRREVGRTTMRHDLRIDGEFVTVIDDQWAGLIDDLIAAARQAEELRSVLDATTRAFTENLPESPAPLPEGMERTVMASGADILRHGWEWRHPVQGWQATDSPLTLHPHLRYECRPPQQPTTERVPWWEALRGRRVEHPEGGFQVPSAYITARHALRFADGQVVNIPGVVGRVTVLTEGSES